MPTQIEIGGEHPWAPLAEAIMRERTLATAPPAASIVDQIRTELNRLGAETFTVNGTLTHRQNVLDYIATADEAGLNRILAGLASTPTPTKEI
jgi:hypothetical protein